MARNSGVDMFTAVAMAKGMWNSATR